MTDNQTHYTYRITHIPTGMYYIGMRTCKGDPHHDLGIKYFSSSCNREFIQDQKRSPDCYQYEILNIYSSREELRLAEIIIHRIWQVKDDPKSYNRINAGLKRFYCEGMKWTHSQRVEHSKKLKGKKRGEITCARISKATKGKSKPHHVQDLMRENSQQLAELRSQGYYKVTRIKDKKVMCVGKFVQWTMGLEGWYQVTRICDKKQMDLCQFKNWYNASFRAKPHEIQVTRIQDRKVMNLKQFRGWVNKMGRKARMMLVT